jgi:hypothetical protein
LENKQYGGGTVCPMLQSIVSFSTTFQHFNCRKDKKYTKYAMKIFEERKPEWEMFFIDKFDCFERAICRANRC